MKYFELEPLPYSDHALEPVIGRETLTSLYTDVYSHSVSQLNQLVEDYPDLRFGHIDCLLGGLSHVPQEIRQDIQRYGRAYKNVTLFLHTLTSPNTHTINGCYYFYKRTNQSDYEHANCNLRHQSMGLHVRPFQP